MIDVMIPLQVDSRTPVYMQIYEYFRRQMETGVLRAGEKLPSSRGLAQRLEVSRSTVIMAYEQLAAEGYLFTRQGSGYYVCDLAAELTEHGAFGADRTPQPKNVFSETGQRGEKKSGGIDFSPWGIDLEHFPISDWRRISRDILNYANKELFGAGNRKGEPELRGILAAYLYSARGVNCRPEQIVVGAGSEYLLTLLCHLLGENRPLSIAMESPTYKQAYRVITSLGHEVVPIEMDAGGMRVEELEKSSARIAYVMPSHQFPTGIVMPVSRRRELLAWAGKRAGRFIIEDDYDSEFRYKGKPIPSLQGMGGSDRVIYLGTFSKSVAPAIRISFMVLPDCLLEPFERLWGFQSSTVSRVDQKILYHFMQEGFYERHLNRMRALYREKHDTLLEALEPFRPYFAVTGEYAGLHLLLTARKTPADCLEKRLVEQAQRAGVTVYPMSAYRIGGETASATVLLGYATLKKEEIREGISRLMQAWHGMLEEGNGGK